MQNKFSKIHPELQIAANVSHAHRLKDCGIACEINVVAGVFHGFDVFDVQVPMVQEFKKSQIAALKKYLVTL